MYRYFKLFLVSLVLSDILFEIAYPEEYDFKYGFMWVFLLAALIGMARAVVAHVYLMKNIEMDSQKQEQFRKFYEEMQRSMREQQQRVFVQTAGERLFDITDPGNVDKKVLKAKYRELSRKYHPDLGGTEEDMKRVNGIYESLKMKYGLVG